MTLKWGLWLGKATKKQNHWSVNTQGVMGTISRNPKSSWNKDKEQYQHVFVHPGWRGDHWEAGGASSQMVSLWCSNISGFQKYVQRMAGMRSLVGVQQQLCWDLYLLLPSPPLVCCVALSKSHTFSLFQLSQPTNGFDHAESGRNSAKAGCNYVTAQK